MVRELTSRVRKPYKGEPRLRIMEEGKGRRREVECDACDRTPMVITHHIFWSVTELWPEGRWGEINLCCDCEIHALIDDMMEITREWWVE